MPDAADLDALLARWNHGAPPPVPPAAAVRARGERRRRRTRVVLASAVASVAVLAAGLAYGLGDDVRPQPPVTSESPSSPATTPSASASAAPSPSATPSSSPSASPAARGTSRGELIKGVLMPHHLSGDWEITGEGLEIRKTRLDPCGDTAWPAERHRRDGYWRELRAVDASGEPVPEGAFFAEDAVAYTTADAATDAVDGYERATRTCSSRVVDGRYEVTHTVIQQEPLLIERTYRTVSGEPMSMYPTYFGVARVRDVLVLLDMSFGEGPNRAGARDLLTRARAAMCQSAGC